MPVYQLLKEMVAKNGGSEMTKAKFGMTPVSKIVKQLRIHPDVIEMLPGMQGRKHLSPLEVQVLTSMVAETRFKAQQARERLGIKRA